MIKLMNKKERAMRTEKVEFEPRLGKVIGNEEVFDLFYRGLKEVAVQRNVFLSLPQYLDIGVLRRISDTNIPLNFSIDIHQVTGDGHVFTLDPAEVSKQAINESKRYRVIYKFGVEGVYQVNDKRLCEGVYVLAGGNKPIIRIDIGDMKGYIAGPMTFREVDGHSIFTYSPNLDLSRNVTIETSVPKKVRSGREGLIKKLFLDVHGQICERYREK
jgi:hypothetical protein